MLNPQIAEQRLKEFQTDKPEKAQQNRARVLSEPARTHALALLELTPDEKPFITADFGQYEKRDKQRTALVKAQAAAYAWLENQDAPEREAFLGAFFPGLASLLARYWKRDGAVIYQRGYARRPFRLLVGENTSDEAKKAIADNNQTVFIALQLNVTEYQEMPVEWFAKWAAYLGAYQADTFGTLFAFAIDTKTPEGDAVFDILMETARGTHEIGAMGRHVTRGLLSASRPDGWELMEKTLLAAQRQEGLRQSILEVIDEAHPQAFRRMLRIVRENDLFRFSATIRAADVWFGMNWVAYEKLSVKAANTATELVETFLSDADARDKALAESPDGQTVYLALWSMAFDNTADAIQAALPLLQDNLVVRRYAAVYFLAQTNLDSVRPAFLTAFDDPDLRIAQKGYQSSYWYINNEKIVAGDDRFERIERNIPRFPKKEQKLEPVIWEWDVLSAHVESLANTLNSVLGDRDVARLLPYVPLMNSYGRGGVVSTIAKQKTKTPEMREVLFKMAGDLDSYVRTKAFEALQKFDVTPDEAEGVEALLTRKAADLRKSAIGLLLKQPDEAALASGKRLTNAKIGDQRTAGLDLLTQMVDKKRKPNEAKTIVREFAQSRGDKLTDAETRMTAPLLSETTEEKPTLDNALGLMDNALRTFAPPPMERDRVYATNSARAIISGLNAFVKQHKEVPLKSRYDDGDETLLGNIESSWQMMAPDETLSLEADKERFALTDLLMDWWNSRPDTMRDADGWELVRADLAHTVRNYPRPDAEEGEETGKKGLWAQIVGRFAKETPLFSQAEKTATVVPVLLEWLLRFFPPQNAQQLADFYMDGAETILARAGDNFLNEKGGLKGGERSLTYLKVARRHQRQHEADWTPKQTTLLWNLIRRTEEPTPKSRRYNTAELSDVCPAYAVGAANENDVYDLLLTDRDTGYYRRFTDLQTLSGRKNVPLLDKTPGLAEIVNNCRKRILEIEVRRGDTETAASKPANALRWSGGMDVLLAFTSALGKDNLVRGYSYYGGENRANVFSHVIRATFPGETDTPEAFTTACKAAQITEKRLLEIAMYAPQWAAHAEAALGWPGLMQAVWWLHAHTKDNSWSVEEEIREAWTAEIASRTPLSAEDLTEGAVDVSWFAQTHKALGEDRWKLLDEAAKYASSSGGHKRAQLFADAMLARVEIDDLLSRISDKRNQDALRALGLLPLPKAEKQKEAEVLRRYKVMQEFLRTAKQFGAQRQESEKLAARIGMENLARTSGYADPLRLTWAMEAAANADLQNGPVTKTVGEVSVSLGINGLGLPEIAVVKKGKALQNIPPSVKKEAEIAELVARKTEITRQVSRMREGLEGAMCRGDLFTGAEVESLLLHPVLRPLLQNVVFIEAEGGKEPLIGYPAEGGKALENCDANTVPLNAKTELRIAHPFDLLQTGQWDKWQKDCFLRERVQPFKQVFRELYVLTDNEKTDNNKSRRYAGHQVNPKQALGLFGKRGWRGGGDYDYDSDGPTKTYHEAGISASVEFMGTTFGPADVEGSTVEEIRFTKKGDWKTLPLSDVPPRLFSEAMRDLDLVVSVAHVGGVDPEASQSTTEMRAALLREAMNLLKLDNVRVEKNHALVEGTLANYNVHLGSATVHRQPGGFLCIVPVHSQHRGRVFLPFVDDDPRTAEVISKVLLLAKDGEIKDPTILEQILRVR